MSTFFQKLTGSQTAPDSADTTEIETDSSLKPTPPPPQQVRKAPRQTSVATKERTAATRLRVENETPPQPSQPREAAPEDEGELTVDIYDAGDAIVIQSTVAGVKPEDLDVSITTDTVTIRGSREPDGGVREDSYYYKELFWGAFSRSVILPEEIDEDAAEATLKYGLLTIRLPKKRKNIAQKLKVKAV